MTAVIKDGVKAYLKSNPEVNRVLENAKWTAMNDGYGQVVYEDEPGSVAYVRSCLYGTWGYQTEDKIIVKVEIQY